MITVKLLNAGGELDRYDDLSTAAEAAQVAIDMIKAAGELYPGDRIVVEGEEA